MIPSSGSSSSFPLSPPRAATVALRVSRRSPGRSDALPAGVAGGKQLRVDAGSSVHISGRIRCRFGRSPVLAHVVYGVMPSFSPFVFWSLSSAPASGSEAWKTSLVHRCPWRTAEGIVSGRSSFNKLAVWWCDVALLSLCILAESSFPGRRGVEGGGGCAGSWRCAGRLILSLFSSDPDAEQRRSPRKLLRGDGWADFAAPMTFLAEGRPSAATVSAGCSLQPPMWRPHFVSLEAMPVRHGALAVPSGCVPGGDGIDPELDVGPDRVSKIQFEVLFENYQGLVCNFVYALGPDVICCVILFPN